jgi:hypothetical protein
LYHLAFVSLLLETIRFISLKQKKSRQAAQIKQNFSQDTVFVPGSFRCCKDKAYSFPFLVKSTRQCNGEFSKGYRKTNVVPIIMNKGIRILLCSGSVVTPLLKIAFSHFVGHPVNTGDQSQTDGFFLLQPV